MWINTVQSDRSQVTIWNDACALHALYQRLETHTQNMQYLLLFRCKPGHTNVPQCCVKSMLPVLFFFQPPDFSHAYSLTVQLKLKNLNTLAFQKASLYITHLTLACKSLNPGPLQLTTAWTRAYEYQRNRGYHSLRQKHDRCYSSLCLYFLLFASIYYFLACTKNNGSEGSKVISTDMTKQVAEGYCKLL